MATKLPSETPTGYDQMRTNIKGLLKRLSDIQELGIAQFTPLVERIINTRSNDACHIQHTLDYLLDFACHPAGLQLYKTLCRYYYTLDPAATVDYINAYREMWDSETLEVKT